MALDVSGIPRKNLNVRLIDGKAVVEAKLVDEDKFGTIERQFVRKVTVPSDIKLKDLVCEFSTEGVLRLMGKKTPAPSETSDSITIIDAE